MDVILSLTPAELAALGMLIEDTAAGRDYRWDDALTSAHPKIVNAYAAWTKRLIADRIKVIW